RSSGSTDAAPDAAPDVQTDATITCANNAACPSGTVCDRFLGRCAECGSYLDCPADRPVCASSHCVAAVPCVSPRTCPGQVCDTVQGRCVDCVVDSDCPMGSTCTHLACEPRRSCTSARDCSTTGLTCDLPNGVCVECVGQVDCDPGFYCATNHTCLPLTDAGP